MNIAATMERSKRWDRPFGPPMSDLDLERVLRLPSFAEIDQDRFPENQSLRDIIRNDGRIVQFQRGEIIIRNGDYGHSVFFIMEGTVRVVYDDGNTRGSGLSADAGRAWLSRVLRQLWRNFRQNSWVPEARDVATYRGAANTSLRTGVTSARVYIKDVDKYFAGYQTFQLDEGKTFGEIAALSRSPRTATVVAENEVKLLELRWQGVRDIRKRDSKLREMLDQLYRERRLVTQLRDSPIFSHLDDEALTRVADSAVFESYGRHDWFLEDKRIEERSSAEVLSSEPVIAGEGEYLDGLIILCSGHARLTQKLDFGERTIGYLRPNELFGLEEIVAHWRGESGLKAATTLRAIGLVDIVRVPTCLIQELVLPAVSCEVLPKTARKGQMNGEAVDIITSSLDQRLLDFFINRRTINGTATMLIDTTLCTGCDECVKACAATHDNNPRFIRHGPQFDKLQVASACMHCADPVCLIDCPTGAIGRNSTDGRVLIDDLICIGCGTCATSCPYNNIQLVEIRDRNGSFVVDSETSKPILKATKCDLCYGQLGGPACQRACPQDALVRIDMHDLPKLAEWVSR